MAEQAVVKSSTPHISEIPGSDFQRFKDALGCVVSVPKEAVDKAIAENVAQKRQGKEKVKNG